MSTSIPLDSAFAEAIRHTLSDYQPRRILETGTFEGAGSTAIFLDYLRSHPTCYFRTIEGDPTCCEKASPLCGEYLLRGLSIPRQLLPSVEEIAAQIAALPEGIAIDHEPEDRAERYFGETDKNGPDDEIGNFCRMFGQPDFALLDSAGHIGLTEALHLISHCSEPCIIALDDTRHFKHWATIRTIGPSPKCDVLASGDERNGWAIVRYTP